MTDQKVAIVTGAGSGVGRATARLLAEAGWAVVLVGRSHGKLQDTASTMGPGHLIRPCDVTDASACQGLVTGADSKYQRIDGVANIAGHAQLAPIAETTPALWRRTIDTNLSAVVAITRAVWPVFERQKSGVVVNVSSMASIDPFPGFAAYAAAKAGVNMFTKVTADEGKAIGVRAMAIAPGAVETPMLRSLFDEGTIGKDQTLAPEAVGQAIVDRLTGAADFTPGEVLTMNR